MIGNELFGQWLSAPVSGVALRLVVEQMSEAAPFASAAGGELHVEPALSPHVSFSSGLSWPWRAEADDPAPSITWRVRRGARFVSLRIQQTSGEHWIRRYRIEISEDGILWKIATASRLLDARHRQPCRLAQHVTELDSSLLPAGQGTRWASSFFEDFLLRAVETTGPDSRYPNGLSGECFLTASAQPFFFSGVYNSGDCGNFDALIAAVLSPELAVTSQRLFPDLIGRFGFMPGVMNPGFKGDRAFALDYSGTTWGPCCYWDLFAWSGDREFLRWFSDACATWARWWITNRDRNNDGWLEPGTNGCQPASEDFRRAGGRDNPELARICPEFWDHVGLHHVQVSAFEQAIYEAPWDDGPIYLRGRNRGLKFDPRTCSLSIHYIETQLYISLLCGFVAHAYRLLGRDGEAGECSRHSRRLAQLVKHHCWDESSGFYYDRDADSGQLRTFVKHAGAFLPMVLGLPDMSQARRMVEHLTNPAEFWTDFPVPTISRDSPDYSPLHYWSGRAWPPINFFVLRGLLNYGFFDVADELLRRWMDHTRSCIDRPVRDLRSVGQWESRQDVRRADIRDIQWIVPENWNPETGEVNGSGGLVWGGLWLPAVIMRHFWPVAGGALLRGGGRFALRWGDRWDVHVDELRATVNGSSYDLPRGATCMLDERTGRLQVLEPGRADPVCLMQSF